MRYLIDTDVLIYLSNGAPEAIEFFERVLMGSDTAISTVTYAELYAGVGPGNFPDQARARIEHFVLSSHFEIIPLAAEAARYGGILSGSLKASGLTTSLLDLMNAAIAIVHDYTLVTRNVRHRERVPNLNFVSPIEP